MNGIPTLARVQGVVGSLGHEPQVGGVVVGRILVNVVDDLARTKVASDQSLHYKSVLHHVPLGVGARVVGDAARPVATVTPVAHKAAAPRLPGLGRHPARQAAILPAPTPGGADVLSAVAASVRRRLSPALRQVALPRAVARRVLASVLRVKVGAARFAGQCHPKSFHALNIAHQERYCEIAARRCSQEVLAL